MRYLADENIPPTVIQQLRQDGHDVLSVRESMRGGNDSAILARSVAEERVLITFDKDFGELACRHQLASACGIILFRLIQRSRESLNARVMEVLRSRHDWAGAFWIVTDQRIRRRSLPNIRQ